MILNELKLHLNCIAFEIEKSVTEWNFKIYYLKFVIYKLYDLLLS